MRESYKSSRASKARGSGAGETTELTSGACVAVTEGKA
jgi:hypothetical protein